MARVCALTGKKPAAGNNVSHSNRKTKRRFLPNLFWKRFVDPRTGKPFRARVSAKAIKTITKNPKKLLVLAKKVVGRIEMPKKEEVTVEVVAEKAE